MDEFSSEFSSYRARSSCLINPQPQGRIGSPMQTSVTVMHACFRIPSRCAWLTLLHLSAHALGLSNLRTPAALACNQGTLGSITGGESARQGFPFPIAPYITN